MTVPTDPSTRNGVALHIDGVSHQFDLHGAALPVLQDVDLKVAPGELVALLGRSGSGKSTLLRLASGLEQPTRGHILVDGEVTTGPHRSRALVFQDPTLFPWRSVRRNVALGPEARGTASRDRDRVERALATVGLAKFADALPHQLSGGMAQRVALARALVNDPSLLLLDEPLGRLDALTRLSLQQELLRLWQTEGPTTLLVTHDVDEAIYLASRIVVLGPRPGRIVADLPVEIDYPRDHDDPAVRDLRHRVLRLLGFEQP